MKYFIILSAILVVPQALSSSIPLLYHHSRSAHGNGWSSNEGVSTHFRENRGLSQSISIPPLQPYSSIASRDKLVSGYANKVVFFEDMKEIRKLAKSYIQTQILAQSDELNSLGSNQVSLSNFKDESTRIQAMSEKFTQQMNAIINISKKQATQLAYKSLAAITSPKAKKKLYQELRQTLLALDRIRNKAVTVSNFHLKKAAQISWHAFKKTLKAREQ